MERKRERETSPSPSVFTEGIQYGRRTLAELGIEGGRKGGDGWKHHVGSTHGCGASR